MQPAKLVRRQPLPLLLDVGRTIRERSDGRICSQLRRQIGKSRIGAFVAAVPTEKHPQVSAGKTDLLEIEQRHSSHRVDRIV